MQCLRGGEWSSQSDPLRQEGGYLMGGRPPFGLTVDTDNLSNGEHMDELFPRIFFFFPSLYLGAARCQDAHKLTLEGCRAPQVFSRKYIGAHFVLEKAFFFFFLSFF